MSLPHPPGPDQPLEPTWAPPPPAQPAWAHPTAGPAAPAPAYPYAPQVTNTSGLAVAVLVVAATVLVAQLATTVLSYGVEAKVRAAAAAGEVPVFAYDVAGVLYLVALLVSYVVTCTWLWQVRRNTVVLLGRDAHERSKVWVWLGWWVPVVALWFPYQVVRDLQAQATYGTRRRSAGLGLWWACWLGVGLIGRISSAAVDDVDSMSALPVADTLVAVLTAVALARWISIVRTIDGAMSDHLHARLG